jgi:hypothetical protein
VVSTQSTTRYRKRIFFFFFFFGEVLLVLLFIVLKISLQLKIANLRNAYYTMPNWVALILGISNYEVEKRSGFVAGGSARLDWSRKWRLRELGVLRTCCHFVSSPFWGGGEGER